ncbi:MAG: ATP-binding protein [Treponema sp.]|nr:ATP-binding protein [Treponema sp.]
MFIPESIPSRIIDLIADICCYHQESFEEVMTLPQVQNGVFDDYCHPCFIACMIRLGDVLDVDNNRFSPVIISTLPSIPTDSLRHIEKHLSITNLNINSNEISIKAECKTIEVGEITNAWFSWISNEINMQTKNWHKIIPDSSFRSLPIIKQLDVKIKSFDVIPGNEIPHFSIASNKATELLQGSGIYNNKFIFTRELLQNSIDATLLRIFIDFQSKLISGTFEDFKNICKKYKDNYRILFKIQTDKKDDSILNICIEDQGIGINLDDLRYIISNGEKGKNPKTDIIKSMPTWMMPSGIFGIGLYSIFLITDHFSIESTKINDGSSIYSILYDPKSEKKGAVYIQTNKAALSSRIGTKICFQYKSNKFPEHLTFTRKSHSVEKMYRKFDFIKNQATNFELSQIIDEVCALGYYSYIPISIEVDGELVDLYATPPEYQYFDNNNSLEFNINSKEYLNQFFYRNQYLEDFNYHFNFFSLQLNLLCGNAKDKLNLSRTNFKADYFPYFIKTVNDSLVQILEKKFEELDDNIKPFIGMFLELKKGKSITVDTSWRKAWKNYNITINNKNLKLDDICKKKSIVLQHTNKNNDIEKRCSCNSSSITYVYFDSDNIFINFVKPYLLANQYSISWNWNNTDNESIIELSKNKKDYILDFQSFKEHILKYSQMARCLIPCNEKYKELKLSKKYIDSIGYKNILPLSFYLNTETIDYMALPYITEENNTRTHDRLIIPSADDTFYKTIFINRKDENVSENQIKDIYKKFIEDFDGSKKHGTKKKTKSSTKKKGK